MPKEQSLNININPSYEKNFAETKIKTKAEEFIADYKVYNFKDSGIGESWLIGTNVFDGGDSEYANAFTNGIAGCPENLTVPSILTDKNGKTLPVEVIGRGAFISCGYRIKNGITKRVKISRQVKIIKYCGFSSMWDVESFEIEAGSQLETIDNVGMYAIGFDVVSNDPSKRTGTLILPSTLSSVALNAINNCHLFHTIFYCGSYILSTYSSLETNVEKIVIKVTSQYPSGEQIFGRNPDNSQQSIEEAEEVCRNFVSPFNFTDNGENVTITGWWRPESDLIIPSTINGLPVVAIEDEAFEDCMNVTGTVYVPPSVISIGRRSFAGLRQAKRIIVEGNTKAVNIGEEAFAEFGIGREGEEISVTLPSEIGSLGAGVFKGAKVSKVIIKS